MSQGSGVDQTKAVQCSGLVGRLPETWKCEGFWGRLGFTPGFRVSGLGFRAEENYPSPLKERGVLFARKARCVSEAWHNVSLGGRTTATSK